MRVEANSTFTYFYEMVPYAAVAGEVFDGLAARHLLASNADVTQVDDEEPTGDQEQVVEPHDLDVATAKISDVLDWVGNDQERALEAHAIEEAKGDKARPRLLAQLEAIAAGDKTVVEGSEDETSDSDD
jgi:hypothetical protein